MSIPTPSLSSTLLCSPPPFPWRGRSGTRRKSTGSLSRVSGGTVAGSVVPVAAKDPSKFEDQGFETLLMEEVERIAPEEHSKQDGWLSWWVL